jgi:hypothetical protein
MLTGEGKGMTAKFRHHGACTGARHHGGGACKTPVQAKDGARLTSFSPVKRLRACTGGAFTGGVCSDGGDNERSAERTRSCGGGGVSGTARHTEGETEHAGGRAHTGTAP